MDERVTAVLKVHREPTLELRKQPFLYQLQAVQAVKDLEYAALFHEQGLGKTKIGIDLAFTWLKRELVDSVLIVTKKSLVKNWCDELRSHTFIEARVLGQDRRANFQALNSPCRVYLAHYEVFRFERKRLALFLKTRRVGVLLDEAQKIKNPNSTLSKIFLELGPRFARRVIMTGTPVANRPYDIWSQIHFLDQGCALGEDFDTFKHALDLSNDLRDSQSRRDRFEVELGGLFDRIKSFSVRETKLSAEIQLPEKVLRSLPCEMETDQADLYRRIREELAVTVVQDGRTVIDDSEDVLKRLLRLVQVASNPALIDEAYHHLPGKFSTLQKLLSEVLKAGEKAIVWTSFTENVDWLGRELADFGVARVHGKLAITHRNAAIERFKTDDACRLLIATPGAAKEGLTLTVANHAIFYDRSFSLDDYLQAQDRIHRISQNRPCFITNLLATGTIDEWVDALLAAKHLAAQLAQGDIDQQAYRERADYDFARIIGDILGVKGEMV